MNVIKTAIELDIFQEMKLEENTGEIVMRPMAELMDRPLDYIDEEDEPEWATLSEVLTEMFIEPYTVPSSTEVPDEKDYHMIVAASEDLLKVAKDFDKIQWTEEDVFGTKMKVSEPLAMASAAGWYVGQICEENDFLQPFDRLTDYMSKEDALKLLKKEIF